MAAFLAMFNFSPDMLLERSITSTMSRPGISSLSSTVIFTGSMASRSVSSYKPGPKEDLPPTATKPPPSTRTKVSRELISFSSSL